MGGMTEDLLREVFRRVQFLIATPRGIDRLFI